MTKVSAFATAALLLMGVSPGAASTCPAELDETCICSFDEGELSGKRCTFKEETTWDMGTSNSTDDITGRLFYSIDYDGSGNADSSYCVSQLEGLEFDEFCVNLNGCTADTVSIQRNLCTCDIKVGNTECTSCTICDGDTQAFSYDCSNVVEDLKSDTCQPLAEYAELVPLLGDNSGARTLFVALPIVASAAAFFLSTMV